ncbi:MAG: ATP-dependent Clp protease adapter ClpS [SAR324 cluster bacterium]|nr:ATP-dependent Clp protease adapter ClpS [SAR324 cluster bacterium]MBF0351342.1 ATP-dependent Clp protease adapter ClpS [SAR324 cluster bacterium]
MSNFRTEEEVGSKTRQQLRPPSMYKVLLHNDDYTTMEFVVLVLESVFHKNSAEATQIMLEVHHRGFGVCGIYPFEIAETKVEDVHDLAKQHEFPLKASMDEV